MHAKKHLLREIVEVQLLAMKGVLQFTRQPLHQQQTGATNLHAEVHRSTLLPTYLMLSKFQLS